MIGECPLHKSHITQLYPCFETNSPWKIKNKKIKNACSLNCNRILVWKIIKLWQIKKQSISRKPDEDILICQLLNQFLFIQKFLWQAIWQLQADNSNHTTGFKNIFSMQYWINYELIKIQDFKNPYHLLPHQLQAEIYFQ